PRGPASAAQGGGARRDGGVRARQAFGSHQDVQAELPDRARATGRRGRAPGRGSRVKSVKSILITGVTGYVGGALAARLLARGHAVVALARNDADGERSRRSVRRAAAGFGDELGAQDLARLRVLSGEVASLPDDVLAGLDAVWHCAAEMSFA